MNRLIEKNNNNPQKLLLQSMTQQTQNIPLTFVQRRPKVFDVGPTLYKCYSNVSCVYCLLGKSEIACSNPTLAFKFQRNRMFIPRSLVKIQYCGEPPWPRGSVLGLRPPGLEFQILCLEGSVISPST